MGESYYIWLKVPDGDDLKLWREVLIQVLPKCLLARDTPNGNLSKGYMRIALVAGVEECVEGARRMVALFRHD